MASKHEDEPTTLENVTEGLRIEKIDRQAVTVEVHSDAEVEALRSGDAPVSLVEQPPFRTPSNLTSDVAVEVTPKVPEGEYRISWTEGPDTTAYEGTDPPENG